MFAYLGLSHNLYFFCKAIDSVFGGLLSSTMLSSDSKQPRAACKLHFSEMDDNKSGSSYSRNTKTTACISVCGKTVAHIRLNIYSWTLKDKTLLREC